MDKVDINSRDVTEEYVDLESRLKTKKEARDRYIEILRNKTGDVKDIIAAEDAIRKITEEIEAKEGRLRYLNDRIEFSLVEVSIYQAIERSLSKTYEASFGDKATSSFVKGWNFLLSLTLALVRIWPLLIFFTLIIIWKRKWFRKAFKN